MLAPSRALAPPAARGYAGGMEPELAFARAIAGRDHEVDLFGGAVAIARLGRDGVDAHALARELDLIAEAVLARAGEGAGAEALADALAAELFVERGFRGNRERYGDPANSYLDHVVERRLGIPISLSLVYLEIAGRVGLECDGVGFPGHFLVRCGGADGFFVDPFNAGERPTREALLERLRDYPDATASPDALLAAVTRRQILQRMLVNLCVAYRGEDDTARWIAALGLRLRLEAWNAALYLERGLLHYRQGTTALALSDLERYVESDGAAPDPRVSRILDELRAREGESR